MNRRSRFASATLAAVSLVALAGAVTVTLAEPPKDGKDGGAGMPPGMQLPPGMTMEDVQKCIDAATPGEMHKWLTDGAGTWSAKCTMWMGPGAPPVTSEGSAVTTVMLDGKFVKCEHTGEMPGMGPFHGFGIYGYDNVSEKFQSTWIDNMGTGMMSGTGELSSDKKTMTWNFSFNCPITDKPEKMREVETITGKNTRKLEMWMNDPKSRKEYKMMEMVLTRTGDAPATNPFGGTANAANATNASLVNRTVEVGCAMCSYKMKDAKTCTPAAKFDGVTYLLTDSKIDGHALCAAPREAVVSGKINGNTLVASSVELKPAKK